MKTDRIALVLLAAVLPAALLAAGCGKKESAAAETVRALAVRAQPVAARAFERRLTVQGTLEAKNYAHVTSSPAKPPSSRSIPSAAGIR